MNQGIFYLYEYESCTRIRNVGFIRVARSSPSCCMLQIHARSLSAADSGSLCLYAFCHEDGQILAEKVASLSYKGRSVCAKLSLPESCLPIQHTLERLNGFLLLLPDTDPASPDRYWMASDLPPSIRVEQITVPSAKTETREEEAPSQHCAADAAAASLDVPSDRDGNADDAGTASKEPAPTHTADGSDEPALPHHADVQSESPADTADSPTQDATSSASSSTSDSTPDSASAGDSLREQSVSKAADPARLPENARIISHEDLTILPRRLWHLANNSFLLHGCHNYGHLLLFAEHGRAWLGVPGTYSQQEARAADYFGFPRFTNNYRTACSHLTDGSPEDTASSPDGKPCDDKDRIPHNFGHWCRCLGILSQDQKFPFIS